MDFIKFNIIKNACLMSKVIKKPGSYMIGKNERCFICIPEVNDDVVAILDISSSGMCIKSTTSNSLLSEPLNIEVDGCPLGDNWKTIKHESEIKFGNIYAKILCFKKDYVQFSIVKNAPSMSKILKKAGSYMIGSHERCFIRIPEVNDDVVAVLDTCEMNIRSTTSDSRLLDPIHIEVDGCPLGDDRKIIRDGSEVKFGNIHAKISFLKKDLEDNVYEQDDGDDSDTLDYYSVFAKRMDSRVGQSDKKIPYNSHEDLSDESDDDVQILESPDSYDKGNYYKKLLPDDSKEMESDDDIKIIEPDKKLLPDDSKEMESDDDIKIIEPDEVPTQHYKSQSSPQRSTSKGNCYFDLDEDLTLPFAWSSSPEPSTSKGIYHSETALKKNEFSWGFSKGSIQFFEKSPFQNKSATCTSSSSEAKGFSSTDVNASSNLFDDSVYKTSVYESFDQNVTLSNQIPIKNMDLTDQNPSITVFSQSNEKECGLTSSPVKVPHKQETDCSFKEKKLAKLLNDRKKSPDMHNRY